DEFEHHFNWQRKRLEREEYLQELQAITDSNPFTKILEEHQDLLAEMKSAPSVVE
uniref:Uncharacterized protein n=1 Tax=Amphimedon queenslandica TaxID=400682 RepID=A0A1X7SL27_AMPQE